MVHVALTLMMSFAPARGGATPTRISPGVHGCMHVAGHLESGTAEALGILIEAVCDLAKPLAYSPRRSRLCCTGRR